MKNLISNAGRTEQFEIASAATSTEELGNDMYPPAKAVLRAHGVPFSCHTARQVTPADYTRFDRLLVMDRANRFNLQRIIGDDPQGKVAMLLGNRDVADPWYTDDFETAYSDILAGCEMVLKTPGGWTGAGRACIIR